MIDPALASNDEERLALSIFQHMETGTLRAALPDLVSADFIWQNSGLNPLTSMQEVIELMDAGGFRKQIPILNLQTHFTADVLHIASAGNVVFTERIDHHWDAEGRDLMTPHIAGVVELREGRIIAIRDFYDTACYRQQPTLKNTGMTLQAHRDRIREINSA